MTSNWIVYAHISRWDVLLNMANIVSESIISLSLELVKIPQAYVDMRWGSGLDEYKSSLVLLLICYFP